MSYNKQNQNLSIKNLISLYTTSQIYKVHNYSSVHSSIWLFKVQIMDDI